MGMYDEILAQLGSSGIDQLSRKTGLAPADTSRAVAGALPAILAGLAANSARSSNGAEWLSTALDRDHDGSLLDDARCVDARPRAFALAGAVAVRYGRAEQDAGCERRREYPG